MKLCSIQICEFLAITLRVFQANFIRRYLGILSLSAIFCFAIFCPLSAIAQGATDDDIYSYKENYVPTEYAPEADYMFYADAAVLILLMLTAGLLMSRRMRRFRGAIAYLPAITFIWFGIIRGGCICPVGAIGNAALGIVRPELIGWSTLVVFLAPLFFALIWGRVFCTSGCPLGAVQDMLYYRKSFYRLPRWLLRVGVVSTAIILLLTVWFALDGKFFLICRMDPYRVIFHSGYSWVRRGIGLFSGASYENKIIFAGSLTLWVYLLGIILVGLRIPRVFCRSICPYGLLLGIISLVSFRQRTIDKNGCVYCGKCAQVCPVQSITIERKTKTASISTFSCVQCDRCVGVCPKDSITS